MNPELKEVPRLQPTGWIKITAEVEHERSLRKQEENISHSVRYLFPSFPTGGGKLHISSKTHHEFVIGMIRIVRM
jgi:hypothetical protein